MSHDAEREARPIAAAGGGGHRALMSGGHFLRIHQSRGVTNELGDSAGLGVVNGVPFFPRWPRRH